MELSLISDANFEIIIQNEPHEIINIITNIILKGSQKEKKTKNGSMLANKPKTNGVDISFFNPLDWNSFL